MAPVCRRFTIFGFYTVLVASLAIITQVKYNIALPNPLKVWLGSSSHSENTFGIFTLVDGENPVVDIIAIHGLDGHVRNSWMADNGTLWLRDLLPHKIPQARIMSYGYDAYTRGRKQLSYQTIHDHAQALVVELASVRRETQTVRRPIIFVAHSLGGIVLKSALVLAHLAPEGYNSYHRSIDLSTYGIAFLGTPHQGTDATDLGRLLLDIHSIYSDTNDAVIRDLGPHSPVLQQQLSQFSAISRQYNIKFFFELFDTQLGGGIKKKLVPKYSASLPGAIDVESIGLYKDHVGMSKFESDNDRDFQTVARHLSNMVRNAPLKIEKRWELSDQHEEVTTKSQAGEAMMNFVEKGLFPHL